jgi:uncharacterized protein YceH (UPF0502 family)
MVQLLPRQPGARESRWMHLLSGAPSEALLSQPASSANTRSGGSDEQAAEIERLAHRVDVLEIELARMADSLAQLRGELGMTP